jgi:tryptophanase
VAHGLAFVPPRAIKKDMQKQVLSDVGSTTMLEQSNSIFVSLLSDVGSTTMLELP